eukprot:gene18588-biopygen15987
MRGDRRAARDILVGNCGESPGNTPGNAREGPDIFARQHCQQRSTTVCSAAAEPPLKKNSHTFFMFMANTLQCCS